MWKVIVVIFALGNPCVVMEENPAKYYYDRNECMANSSAKHSDIVKSFKEYGYYIDDSTFDCVELTEKTPASDIAYPVSVDKK